MTDHNNAISQRSVRNDRSLARVDPRAILGEGAMHTPCETTPFFSIRRDHTHLDLTPELYTPT